MLFSGRKIFEGLRELGIDSVVTPPASPWCNWIMERWFGSLRRECLNHIPILSLNHAQYTIGEYVNYYNFWRLHLALNKDSPCGRWLHFQLLPPRLSNEKFWVVYIIFISIPRSLSEISLNMC